MNVAIWPFLPVQQMTRFSSINSDNDVSDIGFVKIVRMNIDVESNCDARMFQLRSQTLEDQLEELTKLVDGQGVTSYNLAFPYFMPINECLLNLLIVCNCDSDISVKEVEFAIKCKMVVDVVRMPFVIPYQIRKHASFTAIIKNERSNEFNAIFGKLNVHSKHLTCFAKKSITFWL